MTDSQHRCGTEGEIFEKKRPKQMFESAKQGSGEKARVVEQFHKAVAAWRLPG
jgi:hypothetical protein